MKTNKLKMVNISAHLARTNFGQVLDRVTNSHDRFLVNKKGQAKAIIIGIDDFLENVVKQPKALTDLQEQAKKAGTNTLSLEEIEKEIQAFRNGK